MQITVNLNRRRIAFALRRRFSIFLPETWQEVRQRRRWWRWGATFPAEIFVQKARRDLLGGLDRYATAADRESINTLLKRLLPKVDCTDIAIPEFRHWWHTYLLPKVDAGNMTCVEYALCDELYTTFSEKKEEAALQKLTWCLYRQIDRNAKAARKRGDQRVPLHSIDEIERWLKQRGPAPVEIQLQALLYFAGVKQWVTKVYGTYIFEMPDDDDPDDPDPQQKDPDPTGPDFRWWGIFQAVAEGGVFGNLAQVYQANLHEVCIYLVRKKIESNQRATAASPPKTDFFDEGL